MLLSSWLHRAHHDPITGDALTMLEYLTRQVQVVVRSPWFIVGFNLVTLLMMALGWRDWWNYLASWLAIMIEWVVGTFMFGQTSRDAVCLREIRAISLRLERMERRALHDLDDIGSGGAPAPATRRPTARSRKRDKTA